MTFWWQHVLISTALFRHLNMEGGLIYSRLLCFYRRLRIFTLIIHTRRYFGRKKKRSSTSTTTTPLKSMMTSESCAPQKEQKRPTKRRRKKWRPAIVLSLFIIQLGHLAYCSTRMWEWPCHVSLDVIEQTAAATTQ